MSWRRRSGPQSVSLDEFVGDGAARSADPLDLADAAKRWSTRMAGAGRMLAPRELALPAFSLVRGGDLFERTTPRKTPDGALVETYRAEQLRVHANGVAREEVEFAERHLLRVVRGNAAVLKRMLLAKPIRVDLIPKGRDFRRFGFPPHTNPQAAGIFWNGPDEDVARIGLREEHVERPHLMIHEMAHAAHLLGLTTRERDDIDRMLLPVYRSRTWVEEAVAIYAERAFGADYSEAELRAPGLYGKTRRDWNPRHVFSLFVKEWLCPS